MIVLGTAGQNKSSETEARIMKKMTHAFVLFLSLLLIIALFAGCGSSESSSRAY